MGGTTDTGARRWSAGRRRTTEQISGSREAAAIASALGRDLRNARRSRRLTQAQVGGRIGVSHARYGDLERGNGAGAPLGLWIAAGLAVGRPLAISASRDLDTGPREAGHLAAQEHILRLARSNRIVGTFEMRTRPATNATFVDVGLRDDRRRVLSVIEIWNRFDDLGAGARDFDRKVLDAEELAVVAGGDGAPYRVAGCWVLRATAANRALATRFAATLAARFPGSSRNWVRALTNGTEPPERPGIVWIDPAATRLFDVRLHVPGATRT